MFSKSLSIGVFLIIFSVLPCRMLFSADKDIESKKLVRSKNVSDWYLAIWKDAKVGDWKHTLEFSDFETEKIIQTTRETVTQKTNNIITLKVESSLPGPAGEPSFRDEKLNQPTTPLIQNGDIEGEEIIYFKNHKFKCHFVTKDWGKKVQNGQIISKYYTIWLCKDVPIDGIVKSEAWETTTTSAGEAGPPKITFNSTIFDFGRGQ
jgi:hypothetical protein